MILARKFQYIHFLVQNEHILIRGEGRFFSVTSTNFKKTKLFPRYFKEEPLYKAKLQKLQADEAAKIEELKKFQESKINQSLLKKTVGYKSTIDYSQSNDPTFDKEQIVRIPSDQTKTVQEELEETFTPFRYVYPEFLPDPKLEKRNRICEKLERIDMLRRRSKIEIPEFYVGSIMKVAVSDKYAVGKTNEFLGLCIERGGCGLRAWFTLRNAVDGQGVEIRYEMYNPIIQSIQVLRLEKRLDESLRYLRDCPLEYSTIPMDMVPELRNPDDPVPINTTLVRIKPKPWTVKWHLQGIRGIENLYDQITEKWEYKKWNTHRIAYGTETNEFDLMKIYRETIPAEEQVQIYSEVSPQLAKLTQTLKKQKKKRTFVKPQKVG